MPKELWFFLFIALGLFVILSNTRIIRSPNIALVRRNGKLLENARLKPGLRLVWSFWGLIEVDQDVHVPGGLIDVDVPVERVVSQNQAISFNARILISVIKAPDGFPAFIPAYNFITWLARGSGTSIEEQLESLLSSIVSGAAETVIKAYDPMTITHSPKVNKNIARQIARDVSQTIGAWGVVFKVIVEDLENPLAVSIEQQTQQMTVDQKRITTKADADAYAIKKIREETNDTFALIYTQGMAWKEAKNVTVNQIGTDIVSTIGNVSNTLGTVSQLRRRSRSRGRRRNRNAGETE